MKTKLKLQLKEKSKRTMIKSNTHDDVKSSNENTKAHSLKNEN